MEIMLNCQIIKITELRTDNTYPSLSWNFWLNGTYDSGEVFMEAYAGGGQGWYAYNNGSNKVKYPYFCDALEVFAPLQIHNNKWVMITFVINNTGVKIYTNGTLTDDCNKIVSGFGINVDTTRELRIGSGNSYGWVDFDGIMDEWAIWNKSLTQSEINLLYNNGAGSSRDEVAVDTTLSLITQLISPANDTLTNDKNVTLNATGTATNGNLTNITFYIWNENNSLYNSYYQDIADNLIISNEIIEATSIPFGNYTWNALFCAFNDSNSLCEFDTENNTLIINYTVPFIPAPSQVEDTTIYQTFASTGAGLGIFLSYLGQSIPLLIISLVFIGIIAVIGLSLAVAVKKAFK